MGYADLQHARSGAREAGQRVSGATHVEYDGGRRKPASVISTQPLVKRGFSLTRSDLTRGTAHVTIPPSGVDRRLRSAGRGGTAVGSKAVARGDALKHARFAIATVVALAALVVVGAASAATITRDATSSGRLLVPNAPAPTAGTSGGLPEVDSSTQEEDGLDPGSPIARTAKNSSRGTKGQTPGAALNTSFDGLNFFDQRFANGGNQFSVEPPDQGLCVGNGKVVEVVNDVYQVFDTSGKALINPVDLNTLFGYAPAITRTGPNAGHEGPDVFDPSCLFDPQTGAFFVVASVLDRVGTSATLSGTSHVDILSGTDPTKSFTKYSINTTSDAACFNDGAQTQLGPCFPDYPHIGADANGFYVTTNVFDFFGPNFEGVNVYAMSKSTLASGAFTVPVTLTSTNGVGPDS